MVDAAEDGYFVFGKVAALGLVPDRHLGKSLREIQPHLLQMCEKYGLSVCGEGGEYETFTLDCPLFKQRIVVEDVQTIISSADPVCPVGYINFTKLSLHPKNPNQCCDVFVKKSLDYISDLNESTYNDLSDPDLSETELELIEKGTRFRESLTQNEFISRSNSFGRHLTTSSSPISLVTKSVSLEEPPSPSSVVSSSAALCASSLKTTSNNHGSSVVAVCVSPSFDNSSTGAITGMSGAKVTQLLSPLRIEREIHPLLNQPMAACNQNGWMWIAGIQGCASTLEMGMQLAMKSLTDIASQYSYELTDFCYITLYISTLAEYPLLNRVYGTTFDFQNPPTRVCVECPLPEDCHVILEAIAFRSPKRLRPTFSTTELERINYDHNLSGDSLYKQRQTMHVQGISHWAPANIGPYSQSTRVDEIIYISGQIGLVPGSMKIVDRGIHLQCKLALRHLCRIAQAMNAHGQLRDVVQGICFLTHPAYIAEARRQWERRTTNAIMDYIVIPALPRDALVEWQVWAHTHNDRFEYEETGCSVGDYTISIRRRWNYENNCTAIVCYVSTGLGSSTTQLTQLTDDILNNHCRLAQNLSAENLDEILTYTVNRLFKGYPLSKRLAETTQSGTVNTIREAANLTETINNNNDQMAIGGISAIHLKVFYQVTAAPSVDLLLNALYDFRLKSQETANIVYTVLPACSLHNFSTFLSISGVRHE